NPTRILALDRFIDLLDIASDTLKLAGLGIAHHQVTDAHGIVDLRVDQRFQALRILWRTNSRAASFSSILSIFLFLGLPAPGLAPPFAIRICFSNIIDLGCSILAAERCV